MFMSGIIGAFEMSDVGALFARSTSHTLAKGTI